MSSKPEVPRGFRDFPPEVMELRLKVINTVRNIFEINDFPPMDTPSIEYWETLAGKYGPEAENKLIWRFKDPFSEKEYALRYDLTVPLARYVASHPELQLPFKRHQISYVWRHEEPQRGRYREFLQADIDTVGSKFVESDAEIINTMSLVLEELGLDDFIVK
ncbi:MAG: ATP phosphoribosyltransferase regulatory subunit, partial [Fervidicoccus fontis]